MNWNKSLKQRVGNKKYPTLKRIKIGRALSIIAALPLCTSWLFLISIPMMIPISPTLWVKSKIIDFKEWRMMW